MLEQVEQRPRPGDLILDKNFEPPALSLVLGYTVGAYTSYGFRKVIHIELLHECGQRVKDTAAYYDCTQVEVVCACTRDQRWMLLSGWKNYEQCVDKR